MKTIYITEDKISALKPYVNKVKEPKKARQGIMQYEKSGPDGCVGFEPGGQGFGHMMEDVSPEDVDLSSFKLKDKLNPKFWKNDLLDSRIRLKLLDIADDFIDFMGVSWAEPEDIIMTGSLANFNWSEKYSDIDLHIIMNYKDIDDNEKMVDRFLAAQTVLWGEKHKDLKICGFPIEIYVQDKNAKLNAGGVYSLEKNEWIKKPESDDLTDASINKRWVQRRAAHYMDKIDNLIEKFHKYSDDNFKLEKIDDEREELWKKIKNDRASGFKKGGDEMNDCNIVFKTLRRKGYLEKITSLERKLYDKLNSL